MNFLEFAQKLYPVIGGASSQSAFAKTFFDAITTENAQSALDEQSDVTYCSYYNGHAGITRIAQKNR